MERKIANLGLLPATLNKNVILTYDMNICIILFPVDKFIFKNKLILLKGGREFCIFLALSYSYKAS